MAVLFVITVISEAITLWFCVGLWRSRALTISKVVWTLILIVPIVGPVFDGGLFAAPAQPYDLQGQPYDLQGMDNWGQTHIAVAPKTTIDR